MTAGIDKHIDVDKNGKCDVCEYDNAILTDGNGYDDVPKTGQSNAYLFAFALAAACFFGRYFIKKKA